MTHTFTIMPADANYMYPMVFGGAFFSQMDIAAAVCVDELLASGGGPCDSAVTHKANVTFHKPTYVGDNITIETKVIELRKKAIVVEVKCYRRKRNELVKDFVAEGNFVFVTRCGDMYYPHYLVLE